MRTCSYRPLGWTRKGRPVWPMAGGAGAGDGGGSGSAGGDGGSGGDGGGSGGSTGSTGGSGGSSAAADGGGPTGGSGGTTGGGAAASGDKGYPENTPVAEMTAEQQAAYWRTYARQHEQRNRDLLSLADGTPDGLKNKLTELEQLRQSQMSDQEKAVEAAKAEARTAALREAGGKMVDAHIQAAVTAGRLAKEQADVVLDGLDRTRFLTSDGDVDADKVKTFLDSIAPAKGNGSGFPDLGQGRRDGGTKVSGKEQGREEARRRFGDRAGAAK